MTKRMCCRRKGGRGYEFATCMLTRQDLGVSVSHAKNKMGKRVEPAYVRKRILLIFVPFSFLHFLKLNLFYFHFGNM